MYEASGDLVITGPDLFYLFIYFQYLNTFIQSFEQILVCDEMV